MSLSGLYKSSKSGNVLSERQQQRSCPWCWTHGRFESGNLLSLLRFSAATLGNKCAAWDTWLYLRHYEKSALLLCRVDSLWQNSGDENLLFHTWCFLCLFATVCLNFILFLAYTLILSQRVRTFLPPSRSLSLMLSVCICARSKYKKTINHGSTWFQCLMIALCTCTWEMSIKRTDGMK